MKLTFAVMLSLLFGAPIAHGGIHRVSVTLLDDETGKPLPDRSVEISYDNSVLWHQKFLYGEGETDMDGCFSNVGRTSAGKILIRVLPDKEYYGRCEKISPLLLQLQISRTYRLRRRHPTKLKNREFVICQDVKDEKNLVEPKFAMDLMKGDFLPPYGTGTVADAVISVKVNPTVTTRALQKHQYEIFFPGNGNGGVICKGDSMTDYTCDKVDENKLSQILDATQDSEDHLAFRIRSRFDENGKLVAAHYGYFQRFGQPMTVILESLIDTSRDVIYHNSSLNMSLFSFVNPNSMENNLESWNNLTPDSHASRRINEDGTVGNL